MLRIETILCPTDFSECSTRALQLAGALARGYSARLIVAHVQGPTIIAYGAGVSVPLVAPAEDELKARLAELKQTSPEVPAEYVLLEGPDPAVEILDAARRCRADVIVMGTHGRTGLERLVMGSVAEAVVRRAVCPVMTIHTPLSPS